jgi:hypothetical protein
MESIKAWHIMKEGIIQTIKKFLPQITDAEVQRIVAEIENECLGLKPEDIAACVYRKIEEIKLGKA